MNLRLESKKNKMLFNLGSSILLSFATIRPEWADIRVTEHCNSKCITCNAWTIKSENELTTEEIKDELRQLKDVGIKNVIFIGGEPLLRNDIGVLVNEAHEMGFENRMIVTNGLLLESKAEELLRNGITHITVSVDGVGKTNDAIRGVVGNFDKSIEGIKTVQRLKKQMRLEVPVTIITTLLLNQNVNEIPQLIELSKNLDVYWSFNLLDPNLKIFKGIPFSALLPQDGKKIDEVINYLEKTCRENPQLISTCSHMLDFARNYLKNENRYDFHCVHGYTMVYLGSHGEVYLGCYALDPIGNIRETPLRQILALPSAKDFAKKMYMMDCPGCSNRYDLNVVAKHLLSHQLNCERKRNKKK